MTLRQFAIVTLLFGAGLLAASVARPGSWEPAIGSSPEPVKATVALLADATGRGAGGSNSCDSAIPLRSAVAACQFSDISAA